jgi:dihydrofolate reductase
MKYAVIVACNENGGFAKQGRIPWHISEDLKEFKRVTTATCDPRARNAVIMGRVTWETLPAPLKGRLNIIVSKTMAATHAPPTASDDVIYVPTLLCALDFALLYDAETAFVIGGQRMYDAALQLPFFTVAHVTIVTPNVEECDRYFPIQRVCTQFRITQRSAAKIDAYWDYSFYKFARRKEIFSHDIRI